MGKRTKADGTVEQDKYLVISEKTEHGYYHQYGRITTTKYESGAGWVPYGLDDYYSDGLLYSGLRATCQGSQDTRNSQEREPVYGFSMAYIDEHNVDLRKAKRMVRTLDLVERRLAKMAETRGHVTSWGEYAGRVAEAFGCKGIIIQKSDEAYRRSGYKYETFSIGDGVNRANYMVRQWVAAGERPAGPAAEGEETQR